MAFSMSKLSAFLKPLYNEKTKEFVLSDRFVDESGEPVTISIKSIMQDVNDNLIKLSTKRRKENGADAEYLDKPEYQARLIITCVTDPDFASEELCKAYGVVDPLLVPAKMLMVGEYSKLVKEIMKINGFKDDSEVGEDAKNS